MSAWLDAIFGRIFNSGVEIALSKGINFTTGLYARLNQTTKFVEVSLADLSVGLSQVAASSAGYSVPFILRKAFTAGGASGTADDVTVLGAAPFPFRILDVTILQTTAIGGSSARLRTAAGGGGSFLSGLISTASIGTARNTDTSTRTVPLGGAIFMRRSDRNIDGEIVLLCEKT